MCIEDCEAPTEWPLPESVTESFGEELTFGRDCGGGELIKQDRSAPGTCSRYMWEGRGENV